LRRHLRFGLALQGGQLVSMAKDSITPLFVGVYLGAAQMGYITWATTLAGYPLMLQMPLQRLYMPFFARLQSDSKELARFVSHSLWIANAIAAPLTMITIGLAYPITNFIFGPKWVTALPLFYCIAAGIFFSPSATPLIGALNAIGKSHLTFLVSVMWMVATWAFGVPLMIRFGLIGFGIAIMLVQVTNLVLYWLAWDKLAVSPWRAYWPSWPLAALVALTVGVIEHVRPVTGVATLLAYGTAAIVGYGAILWFVFPRHTRAWVHLIRRRTY